MPSPKPIPNLIDLALPPDVLQNCQGALSLLIETLPLYLVDIGPDDRRRLAKGGPTSTDFVHRGMALIRAMPQYKPGFVEVDEFQRDLDAMELLDVMKDQLRKCLDLVEDSLMLARSDAYATVRAFYKALRAAEAIGSLDAKVAADDLASRLPQAARARPAPKTGTPPKDER
jgi:hypothetical protein